MNKLKVLRLNNLSQLVVNEDPSDVESEIPTNPNPDGDSGGASISQSCKSAKLSWNPPPSELCSATWGVLRANKATHDPSYDRRLACVNNFLQKGPALQITSYKGLYNSLLDSRKVVTNLKADQAVKRVTMYIDPNYVPVSNGRLAYGIQISDPANVGKNIGGGTLPENQNGSSVRMNFKVKKVNGKDRLYAAGYSYHFNRTSKRIVSGGFSGKEELKQYGVGPELSQPLPVGECFILQTEVKLNEVGKSNGSLKISLIKDNKVIDSKTMSNLLYRNNAKWKIIGPYMTTKYNDQTPGPATGSIYYKNHEIYSCSL